MISDASNEAWRTVTYILMTLSMMPLEQVASKHSPQGTVDEENIDKKY